MALKIASGWVEISSAVESRSMTLEQYAKHARDAAFDVSAKAAASAPDRATLSKAIADEAAAAAVVADIAVKS